MRELGFQRRGKNAAARLTAAITQSAASPPGRHGAYKLRLPLIGEPDWPSAGRTGFPPFRGQRESKTSTGAGKDQHINNTNKTALPGI